ncbi:MAG TPA: TerB family tellurite resistance protein [Candidatus Limnocylindrales bacterium]|nr:TerB family tellurite resistance protein [Candidatus Limnocylindrales bacterium]
MAIRRLLGMTPAEEPQDELVPRPPAPATDSAATETVRRIIRELEQVEPERRKLLAGFAYVLSRAAHADLSFSDDETQLIEKIVADIGKLPESQAVLVVEIAKNQNDLYGGTEDYLVTREFAAKADPDQRRRTVEACFMIVASDHEITAEEYAELTQIATELGLSREELNVIRRDYKDNLAAIQKMRGQPQGA